MSKANNLKIKPLGYKENYTEQQIEEIYKCKNDPIYFIQNYIKVISLDNSIIPFTLRDYQKKLINIVHKKRFTIAMMSRQSGKSTTVVSYLLQYALFNSNKRISLSAHNESLAQTLLSKIKTAYENLPSWLQQGVDVLNKNTFEFENGSTIVATATSAKTARGTSNNILLLDEFAFVEDHLAEEFYKSVYPSITQSKTAKIVIISTPNGMNLFYKMWMDAINKKNSYTPLKVTWKDVPTCNVPGWEETTKKNISSIDFAQEFECNFLGSTATLISAKVLSRIPVEAPIKSSDGLDIYEDYQKNHKYVMTVDPSNFMFNERNKQDYSAFVIIDITDPPYRVVAKYRNNEITSSIFPEYVYKVGKQYKFPFLLCESDSNMSVGKALSELEYPELLLCSTVGGRGGYGQSVSHSFDSKRTNYGLAMSEKAKREGCIKLKDLIEANVLLFKDAEILNELFTFVPKKNSWGAAKAKHDDLVMCLVIFSWLTNQEYFKELIDIDIRKYMVNKQERQMNASLQLLGYVNLGVEPDIEISDGLIWRSQGISAFF